jgi:hypothetical protein
MPQTIFADRSLAARHTIGGSIGDQIIATVA